jgi:succinate dehydrogenase / fumarate reductase cytochrome b subunit
MSTASTTVAAAASAPARISRKLVLTFLGIVPLGVYVVLHLWTNMQSLAGPQAFDAALVASRNHPAFLFLEVFGLGLPIVVHAGIGIAETLRSRPNNPAYNYFGNLEYVLQRVTAIGLLLFIGAHVYLARISPAMNSPVGHETWAGMHEALSEWDTFIVYTLGTLGVSYHLANGVRTASIRLGLAVSERAQRRMQYVGMALLVILVGMSGAAIYGFKPFMD